MMVGVAGDGDCLIEGSSTLRNVRRDFPEWHLGRSPYVFWALDVDTPAIRLRVEEAAQHLAGLLLEGYCRQPHVTLDLCGFPATLPRRSDDFGVEFLKRQFAALRRAALPEFDIEVGGLGSFSSAPFLGIGDNRGHIAALRACLAEDGTHRLLGSYVPHVTVGLYAEAWPRESVQRLLAGCRSGNAVSCRIEHLSLMSYNPLEVGGALDALGDFRLASGEMHWHAAAEQLGFSDVSG
jgi:2'-5' RNA ligase